MYDAHRGEFERVKRYWYHPFLVNGLLHYPVISTSKLWWIFKGKGLHYRVRISGSNFRYIPWELCELSEKLQFLLSGEKDLEQVVISSTRAKLREISEVLGTDPDARERDE